MSSINRNYNPTLQLHAQCLIPQSDKPLQTGIKTGSNSNMIDFSPTQKTPGVQSPLNMLNPGAQSPHTNTALSTLGGDGGQLLNKLVEAIRHILSELFSLLRGHQQQGSAFSEQTQREQASTSSQSSSSASSPSSLSVTPHKSEKPFVVQNDFPTEKLVELPRNKSATPSATSGMPTPASESASHTSDKTPAKHDRVKPVVVNEPVSSKTSTTAIDKSDTAQKVTKPAARAAHGQGADMSGMVGFAKESNTTGGNNGEVVTVNTVADLKKNLEDDKARTVRLGANLSADSKVTIKFGANKTLLGTDGGNSLHNIYLASGKTASNDIFQNLNFTHDSRYRENGDMQMFISSGQKYWIDHNTYTGTKDQNPKGLDKLLYVGGTADNVSLTNSKFQNNEYGVILGQPDDSAAAKATYAGYPRMTIANNSFNNLDVRAPGLMRHGNFDVYNNLIDNFHLGFTATGDANILSQANYFENGEDVSRKASNKGVLDDYGDAHFKDIGSNVSFNQKSPVTAWTPGYHRDVKTAEEAKAYDLANAGASVVKG